MGKCKLCLQEKKLLKKSHIIPEKMHEMLFDDKHRLHKVRLSDLLGDKPYIIKPHSGIYEGNILCAKCDNELIGSLENYGCKVLYGDTLNKVTVTVKSFQNERNQKYEVVNDVDYAKFKLFLLSILWRASISTRPEFSEVTLNLLDSERLRKMIYEGNPGNVSDYPISFQSYLLEDTETDLILFPRRVEVYGYPAYILTVTGFIFIFHITDDVQFRPQILNLTITPSRQFHILHLPEGTAMKTIFKLAGFQAN